MQLVIFDPVTPKPYSLETLEQEPLGGTEATVVRLAEHLDAIVLQHNRSENKGRYRTFAADVRPTHLIILRTPSGALDLFTKYPRARKYLWMHDLCGPGTEPGKELADCAPKLAELGVTIVCISDFQAAETRLNFSSLSAGERPIVKRIYLPVGISDAERIAKEFDPNKLVFFSSPHKGLDYALRVFAYLHRMNGELRLYVANPGYRLQDLRMGPGVVNLGPIPHHVVIEHVRNALCTFYPNYVYPETFGLVLAESNTLGTPVITHPIGAATEILADEKQFLPIPKTRLVADQIYRRLPSTREYGERILARIGCFTTYADKIRHWQSGGRPRVHGRAEFSLASVVASWHQILDP